MSAKLVGKYSEGIHSTIFLGAMVHPFVLVFDKLKSVVSACQVHM